MKKKVIIPALLSAATLISLTACGPTDNPDNSSTSATAKGAVNATMVVKGYEWGPAVPKVIVEFEDVVTDFNKDTFTVKTASTKRTITDAYTSDKDGNKVTTPSKYVAFELQVTVNSWGSADASPFTYNSQTGRNSWSTSYVLQLGLAKNKTFKVGDYEYGNGNAWKTFSKDMASNYVVPETALWDKDTFKLENGEYTLQRASFTPDGAKTDGGKNPLIIWLHGAGEGGTDIDIDLLGNEVTALAREEIQKYFTTATQKGAYCLAVQTPTMWMDKNGTGSYNNDADGTKQLSCYDVTLFGAIQDYVNKNSDIDTDRIYIGGCSNGGYMTMNMMFEHGDYFTAFYPICEAYMNKNISDEMINQVKDYNIWFLHAENDTTVDPLATSIPTFYRLLNAGATNVHSTLKEKVVVTEDPTAAAKNIEYMGHYSWIYAFNDDVKTEFDNASVLADYPNITIATEGKDKGKITSSNPYVTNSHCTVANNMWDWMSKQTKASSSTVTTPKNRFEAEDATLTAAEGSGQWDTIKVEDIDGNAASGNKAVGYFTKTGSKLTWTITSNKAVSNATVKFSFAASSSDYALEEGADPSDYSKYYQVLSDTVLKDNYALKVNDATIDLGETTVSADNKEGTLQTVTEQYWDWTTSSMQEHTVEKKVLDYHQFKEYSFTINLVEGDNVISLEKIEGAKGVNVDYMEIDTDAVLTLKAN